MPHSHVDGGSAWRQRAKYLALGFAITGGCLLLSRFVVELLPIDHFSGRQYEAIRSFRSVLATLPFVAVGVVFLLRVVRGKQHRFFSFLLGTLAVPFLLVAWFVGAPVVEEYVHRREFDAEIWRDPDSVEHDVMWPPRLCMIDDLLASGRLDGMHEADLLELLGEPHDKSFPFGAASCDLHYRLGPERGFMRIDSEWLFIDLDEDGRVERTWVYRD